MGDETFRAGSAIPKAAIGLLVACLLAAACGTGTEAESQAPRPADATFCPRVVLAPVPDRFARTDEVTRNLGSGLFGRSIVYSDGARTITVHVGYDALDAFEDIDFEGEGEGAGEGERIGGREFVVVESQALRGGAVVRAGTVELTELEGECRGVTVISNGVSAEEHLEVLGRLAVAD